jgi:hypothetical protein
MALCARLAGVQGNEVPNYGINIQRSGAQPIWYGDPDNPNPVTIANISAGTVNIWIGDNQSVGPNNPNNSTEIAPGGYLSLDGTQPVYYAVADGANAIAQILPGVTSFFLPTTLSGIGGIAGFVQNTAPPTTVPNGSIWFNTSTSSLYTLQGGVWTQQEFNAAQIITAGTIVGSLIAAGTVVAGIVNGTLIQGAEFKQLNSFGALLWHILTNGDMLWYINTGSATQGYLAFSISQNGGTDSFGNDYGPGIGAYTLSGGTYYALALYQGTLIFADATSAGGPWNTYAALQPDPATGAAAYYDNAGNKNYLGTYTVRTTSTININSTSPIQILAANVITGITYHVKIHIVYVGGSTAATAVLGWDGNATVSDVLGTLRRGRNSSNVDNVVPVNQNSALGNFSLAFNAGEICTYEFEGEIAFSAGGTFNVRGQEGTSGDTWAVGINSYIQLSYT